MPNLPNLVLDLIFCHVIGNQSNWDYLPADWAACIMVTGHAEVPRYTRKLLRQCHRFDALGSRGDALPSLSLLRAWLSMFPHHELGLEDLLDRPVRDNDLEAIGWLRDVSGIPLKVTKETVASASENGVAMLDCLWDLHCTTQGRPPSEFPCSTQAIDNARDVETLEWWWQRHRQHGVPFEYVSAVHAAVTGQLPSQQQHRPRTSSSSDGPEMAVCHWWRDRVTADGLALQLNFVDTDDPYGSDGGGPEHDVVRPFNIEDLASLANRGRLDLLEFWASMVDAGHFPPVSMDLVQFHYDPLMYSRMFDIPALEWWLERHRRDGLALPLIPNWLESASSFGRVDTLDWIWRTSRTDPGAFPFAVPAQIEISRETTATVLKWWLDLHDAHQVQLPLLMWKPLRDDTENDLQAFWDLHHRPHPTGADLTVRVCFRHRMSPSNLRVLNWITTHCPPPSYDDDVDDVDCVILGDGVVRAELDYAGTFTQAWNEHKLDMLEELVTQHKDDQDPYFHYTVRFCLSNSAHKNELTMLEWFHGHPALHDKVDGQAASDIASSALYRSHLEFAAKWFQLTRQLGLKPPVSTVLEGVMNLDRSIEVLMWLAATCGPIRPTADVFQSLLESADEYGSRQVLEWIATQGESHGVTAGAIRKPELKAQWEHIQRVARLTACIS